MRKEKIKVKGVKNRMKKYDKKAKEALENLSKHFPQWAKKNLIYVNTPEGREKMKEHNERIARNRRGKA